MSPWLWILERVVRGGMGHHWRARRHRHRHDRSVKIEVQSKAKGGTIHVTFRPIHPHREVQHG